MTKRTSFALGLVGDGISASLTPAMQEHEGHACGLNLTYRRIDAQVEGFTAADLPDVLHWATCLGFDGLNVTHPFKQAIIPFLDELTDGASDLGAVNTVLIRDGRTIGANTDWSGFGQSFRRILPDAVRDRAVLIGAGGAGSAVGYALLEQGASHLTVVDLDHDVTHDLVTRLAKIFGDERVDGATDIARALDDAHGVVNATQVGMIGHDGMPVAPELVRSDLWVADVVYFPLETALTTFARQQGCRVVPGGGMAVFQAVDAFRLFTGREPDVGRMIRYFEELTAE